MTASFTVIVPSLRRPEVLRTTLESILSCDPLPLEIIVVDGDEEHASSRPVVESFDHSLLRYVNTAPGLPYQRNQAIDLALGNVIVFFDDDVKVEPRTFEALAASFEDPSVLGVTGRVIEREHRKVFGKHSPLRKLVPGSGTEGSFTRYGYPRRLVDRDTKRDIHFMHGSCMAVRTEVARSVRFDEKLRGYALGEDEDFSFRVSRHGRIVYDPNVIVHHAKVGATGSDARRFGRQVVVNRHYLFHKNFPTGIFARLQFGLLIAMLILHRLLNREWSGALGLLDGVAAIWKNKA